MVLKNVHEDHQVHLSIHRHVRQACRLSNHMPLRYTHMQLLPFWCTTSTTHACRCIPCQAFPPPGLSSSPTNKLPLPQFPGPLLLDMPGRIRGGAPLCPLQLPTLAAPRVPRTLAAEAPQQARRHALQVNCRAAAAAAGLSSHVQMNVEMQGPTAPCIAQRMEFV